MKHLIALCTLILFLACGEQKVEQPSEVIANPKVTGLWSLFAMEKLDSLTGKWMNWNGGMQGYILYDDSENMALHLTKKGYEETDLVFPNFVDTLPIEALKYLTNSYCYFAKYKLDTLNGIVTHKRISHSNPSEWNAIVDRKYSFRGDTLIIAPVESRNSALRLKWLRD